MEKNHPASKQCLDEFPQGTAENDASDIQDWAQKAAQSDLCAAMQQHLASLASPGWEHAGALQPAEVVHCLEIPLQSQVWGFVTKMRDSKAAVLMVAHTSFCRVGFLRSTLVEARNC